MSSRIYDEVDAKRFDVHFIDENCRAFKRVVWAITSEHAVATAMTDDRAAGGGSISFLRCVAHL